MLSFFLCIHPFARLAALLLLAAAIIHGSLSLGLRHKIPRRAFAGYGLLIILSLLLGSYAFSPLGFAGGRIPLLSGFIITRPQRAPEQIASGQVISMAAGTPLAIHARLLPGPATCMWSSSNGGAFDDPAACDTVYAPSDQASFSVLRVSIRSACSLPPAVGEIKIGVLP